MAATALTTYAFSAESAAEKSKALADQIDNVVGNLQQLNVRQLDELIDKQSQAVVDLRQSYLRTAASPAPDIPLYKQLFLSRAALREAQITASNETAKASGRLANELAAAESRLKQLENKRNTVLRKPDKPASVPKETLGTPWSGQDSPTEKSGQKRARDQYQQLR